MKVLVVPGEAAELQAVEEWAEPSSGAARWVRAVPFVRAPYALKAGAYDLVLCDLAHGAETGLDLLREVRAAGMNVPFVFLARAAKATDVGFSISTTSLLSMKLWVMKQAISCYKLLLIE